jgi:osmotically-inducible protein OsmY
MMAPNSSRPNTHPTAPTASDLAERRLHRHSHLALRRVRCEVKNGLLVLHGCLPSYYLKQVAQSLVCGLEGIRGVENRIEVVAGGSRS